MSRFDGFEKWLLAQDYAEQTVRGTMVQIRKLEADQAEAVAPEELAQPTRRTHLLRMIAGHDAGHVPEELGEYARAVLAVLENKPKGIRGGRKSRKRKREARSVSDDQWPTFLAKLEELASTEGRDQNPAIVLALEAATGLRIGDILRIPRASLFAAARSGTVHLETKGGRQRSLLLVGAEAQWTRLIEMMRASKPATGENVAAVVSDGETDYSSSGAAYKRCARLLSRLETELGLDHLHTHRLRRTIAVQALRTTGDIPAVQEMLGQEPGSRAVYSYVDEARGTDVAELTRSLAGKFGKKAT